MHLKQVPLGALYDKTGLHPDFIRRVFRGQPTSEQTIRKLADAIGVPPWKAYKQILEIRQEQEVKA
jgi:hypothetical protein